MITDYLCVLFSCVILYVYVCAIKITADFRGQPRAN